MLHVSVHKNFHSEPQCLTHIREKVIAMYVYYQCRYHHDHISTSKCLFIRLSIHHGTLLTLQVIELTLRCFLLTEEFEGSQWDTVESARKVGMHIRNIRGSRTIIYVVSENCISPYHHVTTTTKISVTVRGASKLFLEN